MSEHKDSHNEEDCLSAASFEIKICKKKEEKKEPEAPPPEKPSHLKLVLSLTLTLSLTIHLIGSNSSPSPTPDPHPDLPHPDLPIRHLPRSPHPQEPEHPHPHPHVGPEYPHPSTATHHPSFHHEIVVNGQPLKEHVLSNASADSIWSAALIDTVAHYEDLVQFFGQLQQAIATQDYAQLEAFTVDDPIIVMERYDENLHPIQFINVSDTLSRQQLWATLRKTSATGCVPYPTAEFTDTHWFCPSATFSVGPADYYSPARDRPMLGFINGEHVNIRSAPSLSGGIVGTLSYGIVAIDQTRLATLHSSEKNLNTLNALSSPSTSSTLSDAWYPIIWNKQQQGYVASTYLTGLSNQGVLLLKRGPAWSVVVIRLQ